MVKERGANAVRIADLMFHRERNRGLSFRPVDASSVAHAMENERVRTCEFFALLGKNRIERQRQILWRIKGNRNKPWRMVRWQRDGIIGCSARFAESRPVSGRGSRHGGGRGGHDFLGV